MSSSIKDTYVKHNLGKVVLSILQQKAHATGRIFSFLLLSFILLQAEDFTHTFHGDKTEAYVKEPVILTLELNQTNPNMVLLFNFDLVKSDKYSFQRLDTIETDIHKTPGLHHAKVKYIYLVYPLIPEEMNINFTLLKKVTTDESVAYSFSGDRDNVKTLVTRDTPITLPPLSLNVKPLPQGTQLVGDFSLDYSVKEHKANAYEPLPFQVTLKGLGYPPLVKHLILKDVNFTSFTEPPLVKSVATWKGTHTTVHYPMALSHSKSFTLPNITLQAFNPKTQKAYTLTVPEQKFDITEVAKTSLVDKVDSPKALKADWAWLTDLLTYTLVFLAGYLTALSWKWSKKTQTKKDNPLKEKIQNCKDEKALLQVLMAHDPHRFSTSITLLENSLYGNGKMNLSKVKQEVMETL